MKRPLIGVTAGMNKEETYLTIYRPLMDVLCQCGALAVLLPTVDDEALLADTVDSLDGVVFSGGGDVDPLRFGEMQLPACGAISPVRDAYELALARLLAERQDIPVLGICRGFQVMNIALGGDVYQDLPSQYEGELIAHRQKQPEQYPSHPVRLEPASRLAAMTGETSLLVNSLHHQAVRRLGARWQASACAPDGVIEAAEMQDHPFFIGLQWHPERMWRSDRASMAIFQAFTAACAQHIAR